MGENPAASKLGKIQSIKLNNSSSQFNFTPVRRVSADDTGGVTATHHGVTLRDESPLHPRVGVPRNPRRNVAATLQRRMDGAPQHRRSTHPYRHRGRPRAHHGTPTRPPQRPGKRPHGDAGQVGRFPNPPQQDKIAPKPDHVAVPSPFRLPCTPPFPVTRPSRRPRRSSASWKTSCWAAWPPVSPRRWCVRPLNAPVFAPVPCCFAEHCARVFARACRGFPGARFQNFRPRHRLLPLLRRARGAHSPGTPCNTPQWGPQVGWLLGVRAAAAGRCGAMPGGGRRADGQAGCHSLRTTVWQVGSGAVGVPGAPRRPHGVTKQPLCPLPLFRWVRPAQNQTSH